MNQHLMWAASLMGILSTAVVCGTDMFFLTVGRPALRLASSSAATEVMGFFHQYGDARMAIWGIAAYSRRMSPRGPSSAPWRPMHGDASS